jgi:hypothetical protein
MSLFALKAAIHFRVGLELCTCPCFLFFGFWRPSVAWSRGLEEGAGFCHLDLRAASHIYIT